MRLQIGQRRCTREPQSVAKPAALLKTLAAEGVIVALQIV
jgi:hypothetical protein